MAQSQGLSDGSSIKDFVGNDGKFNEFIDKKFTALDADHKGTLSKQELNPMIATLGDALGLPPPGSSKESDHLYDEIFAEFSRGNNVSKETFAKVLKDVFLGLADGLERDPISVLPMDGTKLKEYAGTGKFETDAVSTFTRLDSTAQNRLQAIMIVDALKSISVSKGMPPAGDPKMKILVRDALVTSKVNTEDYLDQFQFVDALKVVVLAIADGMHKSPLEVAHSEKTFDGSSITSLLKDQTTLHQVLDEAWNKLPKDKKGKVSKDYLRVGVDEVSPAAGLPPVGAVDEMDSVLKTVFSKIDLDHGGTITRQEFDKTMLEVLGSLMMQLEGKPIAIENSEVISAEKKSEATVV